MLMLTHTWMLLMFLGPGLARTAERDLFVHNISPDILPIHQDITTDMTHGLPRFRHLPGEYSKAFFTQFHLLVDDIAHYGRICAAAPKIFDPHSNGYAYRKGRLLIAPLLDFHSSIGHRLNYAEAAYRAHIIIEMAFDQVLQDEGGREELVPLFFEALNYTLDDKLEDFCRIAAWFYGIDTATIAEALRIGKEKCAHEERTALFASLNGRIALYIGKFGLDVHHPATWSGLHDLLLQGVEITADYEDFFRKTIAAIRATGFTNPL